MADSSPSTYPGARTLGLRSATPLEAAGSIRRGFSPEAPARLARLVGVPLAEVTRVTRIAPRTLARRTASGGRLTPDESERVLRVAALVEQAVDFFGSTEGARGWLNAPRPVFGGLTPWEMADTEVGAREVERLLGRLAHGVYS